MSGYDLVGWLFCGISLVVNFYIARAIHRRNPIGATYLFGLFLLVVSATIAGLMAQQAQHPFWFLIFLIISVLFCMLVGWRVRETQRVIRGRLALAVWLAGGVILHLSAVIDRLHWDYPLDGFTTLPPWALGTGVGVLWLGAILASLQLRDAEWYFN